MRVPGALMVRPRVFGPIGALGTACFAAWMLRGAGAPTPQSRGGEDLRLEEDLSRCRLYSAAKGELEPDWPAAELACNRVLDAEPIHEEANRLADRVRAERAAMELLRGAEASEAIDELNALELLMQIPDTSRYFDRARIRARAIKVRALPRLRDDCARVLHPGFLRPLLTCEKYFALACQDASWRERNLESNAGKSHGAADELYVRYLRSKGSWGESFESWTCPGTKLFDAVPDAESGAEVRSAILRGASNQYVAEAILSYWEGHLPTALSRLRAAGHRGGADPSARQLGTRIARVMQLLKAGHGALQARDPESAATPFRAALEGDRQIMRGWSSPASAVERIVRREMSSQCYVRGKYWADRADIHRACRIWRLGYSFSQADLALLQAMKHCREHGEKKIAASRDCRELAGASDFFIEGDLALEKIGKRREVLGCL